MASGQNTGDANSEVRFKEINRRHTKFSRTATRAPPMTVGHGDLQHRARAAAVRIRRGALPRLSDIFRRPFGRAGQRGTRRRAERRRRSAHNMESRWRRPLTGKTAKLRDSGFGSPASRSVPAPSRPKPKPIVVRRRRTACGRAGFPWRRNLPRWSGVASQMIEKPGLLMRGSGVCDAGTDLVRTVK